MPSEQAKIAVTAPETAEVFVTLMRIFVDGFRIAAITDDTQTVTSEGVEYTPWGFTAILPNQTAEAANTCRLQIDNVDLSFARMIKGAVNRKITVEVAVVMASTPDSIEQGPFVFVLRNIKIDKKHITGELYDDYMADKKFTSLTYSPGDFPGMFY